MNIVQAEENLKKITTKFSKESFVFDLMESYDFPKSTISKLKIKLKKNPDDDVIVPSKLHFVGVSKKELDAKFDELLQRYATIKKQPRFIVVTDYQTIKAYDTKMGEKLDINIKTLSKHPDFFLPWAGIEKKVFQGENPADVKAAEKLAKFFDLILHDNLKLVEKNRHALNVFLTRVLFCFFAEDTDIFEKGLFTKSINDHTNKDGNDLADYLQRLFEVLNKKSRNGLPDFLKQFPYVNGGLFAEEFPIPKFSKRSRESLIDLGSDLNWAEINPDIFGSMIQAVVHPDQRAGLGMHYTSVTNIMKVIEPLFLSELKEEFVTTKGSKPKLKKLLERISNIKIFDPACGSGNFLIIAYKELRLLEMEILKVLGEIPMSGISLSGFYGIEIDDFAHEVAKLSLWLAEHQMDVLFNREFGDVKASLPLKDSGRIVCENALAVNWDKVCPIKFKEDEVYVLGNPPYLGARLQEDNHKSDLQNCLSNVEDVNNLDYISGWFYKGINFIRGKNAQLAFVSTNSIAQGGQVSGLWPHLLKDGIEISFAHEEFKWGNNAKAKAAVICVIIGLRNRSTAKKFIYDNEQRKEVKSINAYLIDGADVYVEGQRKPLNNFPPVLFGSMANDGGYLILNEEEYKQLIKEDASLSKFIRRLYGSFEFINSVVRYCLWFNDSTEFKSVNNKNISNRIKKCREHRLASKRGATTKLAEVPWRFGEVRFKNSDCIIIPSVSSERRKYIPIGFLPKGAVVTNLAFAAYDASPFVFSLLTSHMHMVWVRTVAGRLKSDYRYSAEICYNTFPVPVLSKNEIEALTLLGHKILETREKFPEKSLGNLYDGEDMPAELKGAHNELDKYVDNIYSKKPFKSDLDRSAILLSMYSTAVEGK